jgi:hypothetical protein
VLGLSTKLYRQITSQTDEDKVRRDAVTLQLGITYKEMSLSRSCGDVDLKVTSGDRAPDAPGLNAIGEPVRLFDFFRGPHFTLLRLFGPDGQMSGRELRGVKRVDVSMAQKADAQAYVDAFGHFASVYGGVTVSTCWCVLTVMWAGSGSKRTCLISIDILRQSCRDKNPRWLHLLSCLLLLPFFA